MPEDPARISRKKPGVAFWATMVVVALVGYALSFGPACWLIESPLQCMTNGRAVAIEAVASIYQPLVALSVDGPKYISKPICWYAGCFSEGDDGRHLMAIFLEIEEFSRPRY